MKLFGGFSLHGNLWKPRRPAHWTQLSSHEWLDASTAEWMATAVDQNKLVYVNTLTQEIFPADDDDDDHSPSSSPRSASPEDGLGINLRKELICHFYTMKSGDESKTLPPSLPDDSTFAEAGGEDRNGLLWVEGNTILHRREKMGGAEGRKMEGGNGDSENKNLEISIKVNDNIPLDLIRDDCETSCFLTTVVSSKDGPECGAMCRDQLSNCILGVYNSLYRDRDDITQVLIKAVVKGVNQVNNNWLSAPLSKTNLLSRASLNGFMFCGPDEKDGLLRLIAFNVGAALDAYIISADGTAQPLAASQNATTLAQIGDGRDDKKRANLFAFECENRVIDFENDDLLIFGPPSLFQRRPVLQIVNKFKSQMRNEFQHHFMPAAKARWRDVQINHTTADDQNATAIATDADSWFINQSSEWLHNSDFSPILQKIAEAEKSSTLGVILLGWRPIESFIGDGTDDSDEKAPTRKRPRDISS